jgi:hypothetical protein
MPPKKKTAGLTAFAKQQAQAKQPREAPARTRAKGEMVALTYRLSRDKWERLHQLAMSEGVSLNQLIDQGISNLLEEKGLPGQ